MNYTRNIKLTTITALLLSVLGTAAPLPAAQAAAAAPNAENSWQADNDAKVWLGGLAALGIIGIMGRQHSSPAEQASGGAVLSASQQPATAQVNTAPPVLSASRALELLNNDRRKNGLKALRLNSQLTILGEKYAQDMIQRNYFSHTNPEGQSPFDRMKQAGITYRYAGENLAINSTVDRAETAFMNSPGHRENILSPNYTDVGIGVKYDAKGSVYVVQEFISK